MTNDEEEFGSILDLFWNVAQLLFQCCEYIHTYTYTPIDINTLQLVAHLWHDS